MTEDTWLIGVVVVVWAALALVYGLVPAFHMPGGTAVWGMGAALFFALALLVGGADRSRGRRKP